jgi:hypothetical protein
MQSGLKQGHALSPLIFELCLIICHYGGAREPDEIKIN